MKEALYLHCIETLSERQNQLKRELEALKDSADSDTKSSMGDKYETSREMINLEKGKIFEQLTNTEKMLLSLKSLDLNKASIKGELGALITTNSAVYFIAVSLGKVVLSGNDYYVLSPMSPVGRALLYKQAGDEIHFAGKTSKIESIL